MTHPERPEGHDAEAAQAAETGDTPEPTVSAEAAASASAEPDASAEPTDLMPAEGAPAGVLAEAALPPPSPFADISLSARKLVGSAFDLMAKSERDLRYASFYLGFLALVTIGPAIALFWAFIVRFGLDAIVAPFLPGAEVGPAQQELMRTAGGAATWLSVGLIVAFIGFVVVVVESQATAVAVLGSRLQGRPLSVTGAVLVARRRFWRVFWATLLVGILATIGQRLVDLVFPPFDPGLGQIGVIVSLVVTLLIQTPFIYAVAGIVLGEVGVAEALRRSTRLFRARPGLAFTAALFGAATQFVLFFGLELGLGLVIRIAEPFGLGEGGIAIFLGTIIGAALTFAFGTLAFTAAALAGAPQVIAFVGLTHYAGGLDLGRAPYEQRRPWNPFITGGLWVAIVIGLGSLFLGILELA